MNHQLTMGDSIAALRLADAQRPENPIDAILAKVDVSAYRNGVRRRPVPAEPPPPTDPDVLRQRRRDGLPVVYASIDLAAELRASCANLDAVVRPWAADTLARHPRSAKRDFGLVVGQLLSEISDLHRWAATTVADSIRRDQLRSLPKSERDVVIDTMRASNPPDDRPDVHTKQLSNGRWLDVLADALDVFTPRLSWMLAHANGETLSDQLVERLSAVDRAARHATDRVDRVRERRRIEAQFAARNAPGVQERARRADADRRARQRARDALKSLPPLEQADALLAMVPDSRPPTSTTRRPR